MTDVLVIAGPAGVGKSSMAFEISLQPAAREVLPLPGPRTQASRFSETKASSRPAVNRLLPSNRG